MQLKISIVVPILNESGQLLNTLQTLQAIEGIYEIIVVDGGSTDHSAEIASKYAKVLFSGKGRAHQMNEGARSSTGDIILFLHADSIISQASINEMARAIRNEHVVGGCFKLAFDDPSLIFRLIALGSNLRARFSKIFFGDQGIFVKRESFFSIGGFPELPILEDWKFSRALKSHGKTLQLNCPIITSSRRFHKYGVWRTLLLMQKIKLWYILGVSPDKLKRLYQDAR